MSTDNARISGASDCAAIRERVCASKHRHPTRGGAKVEAARAREAGVQISVYRCPFCAGFHVGSPPSMGELARIAAAVRKGAGDAD